MPHSKSAQELREIIRVLSAENDILTESAEGAFLLGKLSEKLNASTQIQQALEVGLEQIAILKNIPACIYAAIESDYARAVSYYLSFTETRPANNIFALRAKDIEALKRGEHCLLDERACRTSGLLKWLPKSGLNPKSALLLSTPNKAEENGFFAFLCEETVEEMQRQQSLLLQASKVIAGRHSNLFLAQELERLNAGLEEKIIEKTKTLSQKNQELSILHKTALAGAQSDSEDELITRVTNIIGEALYPDNFGVYLIDESNQTLSPHPSYRGITSAAGRESSHMLKGITGAVAASGASIRVNDTSADERYIEITADTKSELCVPICIGNRTIGVINAESNRKDFFTENDERLLNTIAGHMATALEQIRVHSAEKQRRQEAEVLQKATEVIITTLNQKEAVSLILEQLSQVVPFTSASVQLLRDGYLEIVGGRGSLVLEREIHRRFPFPGNNPNTVVIQERRPLILKNAPEAYPEFLSMPSIQSWLGVPLVVRGRPVGILTLDHNQLNHFSERHVQLVNAFANQAATVIENARLFEAEKKRRQEAEILQETALAMTSSLNLDEAIQHILEQLARILPYDSACVQILKDGHLENFAGRGWKNPDKIIGMRFPIPGDNPNTTVIQERRVVILDNAKEQHAPFRMPPHNHINSWMGVPLIIRDNILGMLAIDSKQFGYFTNESAKTAAAFANQAAIAIENARLYQSALDDIDRRGILHTVSQAMTAQLQDPEMTYKALHHAVMSLMECDAFAISLKNRHATGYTAVYIEEAGQTFHPKALSDASFAATVIKSGETIARNTVDASPSKDDVVISGVPKIRSLIGTPLKIGDKIIGMLTAQSYQDNSYSDHDRILLEMIAAQGAVALENSRLFAETQKHANEFLELYNITQDLTAYQDIDALLKLIARRATRLLGSQYGGIYLYDKTKDELILAVTTGYGEKKAPPLGLRLKRGNGMAWKVLEDKQPLIVDDYRLWDGRSSEFADFPFSAVLEVPMLYAGNIVGVLAVNEIAPATRQFTEDDVHLLSLFASQAAGAVHSARLFEQTRNRITELETIHKVSMALRTAQTSEEMFPIVLDEMLAAFDAPAGTIWLHDPNAKELYRGHARGWIANLKPERHGENEGIMGYVFSSNKPYISADLQTDKRTLPYSRPDMLKEWTAAFVPIRIAKATIGVLSIAAPAPRRFTQNDINILMILAEIAGNALHRAILHERTKQQLRRLTALRNIDTAISSSLNLNVTLNILIDYAVTQLEVDAADILLFNAPLQTLTYASGQGFQTMAFMKTNLRLGEGLPGKAALERRFVSAPSISTVTPHSSREAAFQEEGFKSYFCAPLTAKGMIVGVLEIFNRTHLAPTPEWTDFLKTLGGQAAIAIDNNKLFENLKHSNQELALAYDTTLEGWGQAIEMRDRDTQDHTQRVTDLTIRLARSMGIPDEDIVHIYRGTLLHDIGKMGIPDGILNKNGSLTESEWETMRQHPQFAYDMLSSISFLRPAIDIPYCHHERWDGSGYPRKLKGEEIPLAARIFSVVDVWDALSNDRVYRDAWDPSVVLDYIKNESGTRFDPQVVAAFLEMLEQEGNHPF